MARKGRKRKLVHRENNGRAKRSQPQPKQPDVREVAMNQPHRRGNIDQRCSSPLGRFCIRAKLRMELYDAGEEYAATVNRWRAAKGIPLQGHRTFSTGLDPDSETVDRWRRRMVDMERAMMAVGLKALLAVKQLTLDEADIGIDQDGAALDGLIALAEHLSLMTADNSPFVRAA